MKGKNTNMNNEMKHQREERYQARMREKRLNGEWEEREQTRIKGKQLNMKKNKDTKHE